MQIRFAIRVMGVWLGVVALAGLAGLTIHQHRTISQFSQQNRILAASVKEQEHLRAEIYEAQNLRNQEAELRQLREDNRDLLRLRNEVGQLRQQVKEIDALRAANAGLLQALQGTSLSSTQQAMVAAVRKEGAVLGIIARSANDPQNGAATPARYNGAVVVQLDPNSAVTSSGLAVGDIIVRVDGHPIENIGQLQTEMLTRKPGDTVTLDVMRGDTLLRIPVPTRAWPK
jgi:C-terminal processing protease CtpA/Prc